MNISDKLVEEIMALADNFMDYEEIAEKLKIDVSIVYAVIDAETEELPAIDEDDWRLDYDE